MLKKNVLLLPVHRLSLKYRDNDECGKEEGLCEEDTFQDLLAQANHMLTTNDLYENNQYSQGEEWPSLARVESPWKNKERTQQMAQLV